MNMKEYLKESARTEAHIGLNREHYPDDKSISNELLGLDIANSMADCIKRTLFYGAELYPRVDKHTTRIKTQGDALVEMEDFSYEGKVTHGMLHALLGIASETAEIAEEYNMSVVEGREINKVNLVEEAGDIMWYLAMLLRELDTDFETVGEKNIAKLRVRYPEQFTEEAAVNRDTDKEEEVLK